MQYEPGSVAAEQALAARFARRVRVLIAVTTVLLLACATIGIWMIRESAERHRWVTRTAAIQLETERFRTSVLSAGRMAQQTMFEGRSPQAAVTALRAANLKDLAELRALVVQNAVQTQRLDMLRPLVDQRFDLLMELMSTVGVNLTPLRLDPQAPTRLAVTRRIEVLLDEFNAAEEGLRVRREQAVTDAARITGALTGSMALLALALVALAWRAVRHEMQRRACAELAAQTSTAELTQLNTELERRVDERTQALNERNRGLGRTHAQLSAVSREVLRVAEAERRLLARELLTTSASRWLR